MGEESFSNTYEEIRKKRLLDNQKRFEDLGISKISKSLSDLSKTEKKHQPRQVKPKLSIVSDTEPRRSSRARNPIITYQEEVDVGFPTIRKRSKFNSSWASYIARPLDEIKTASYKERIQALKNAEKLQSNLQSDYPSFVKSMVRSHVYSCFWLGLPSSFCVEHLPKSTVDMVLEDEDGVEYDAVFISKRTGLSGGWRAFALDHKLDDGDALVFELVEPTRFKVYIVKASNNSRKVDDDDMVCAEEGDTDTDTKQKSKRVKKSEEEIHDEPKNSTKSQKTKEVKKKKLKEESPEPKSSTKSQKPKTEKEHMDESNEPNGLPKSDRNQRSTRSSTRTRSMK